MEPKGSGGVVKSIGRGEGCIRCREADRDRRGAIAALVGGGQARDRRTKRVDHIGGRSG